MAINAKTGVEEEPKVKLTRMEQDLQENKEKLRLAIECMQAREKDLDIAKGERDHERRLLDLLETDRKW